MSDVQRKKSPRAPSLSLENAIARAGKIYAKDRRHPVPSDIAAQALGYSGANNGAALGALASLRYFGLVERPKDGFLSVTKEYESYQFAPNAQLKRDLARKWLRTPPLFADLLEKFQDGLPSDATVRFDLIQRGFSPASADAVVLVFKESVAFVRQLEVDTATDDRVDESDTLPEQSSLQRSNSSAPIAARDTPVIGPNAIVEGYDTIPIRLPNRRRAWLVVPVDLASSDKDRIKAQVDLLFTDDD